MISCQEYKYKTYEQKSFARPLGKCRVTVFPNAWLSTLHSQKVDIQGIEETRREGKLIFR